MKHNPKLRWNHAKETPAMKELREVLQAQIDHVNRIANKRLEVWFIENYTREVFHIVKTYNAAVQDGDYNKAADIAEEFIEHTGLSLRKVADDIAEKGRKIREQIFRDLNEAIKEKFYGEENSPADISGDAKTKAFPSGA